MKKCYTIIDICIYNVIIIIMPNQAFSVLSLSLVGGRDFSSSLFAPSAFFLLRLYHRPPQEGISAFPLRHKYLHHIQVASSVLMKILKQFIAVWLQVWLYETRDTQRAVSSANGATTKRPRPPNQKPRPLKGLLRRSCVQAAETKEGFLSSTKPSRTKKGFGFCPRAENQTVQSKIVLWNLIQ